MSFNPLALLGGVGKLWGTVFGSKEKRDQYNSQINNSIHSQFASEFGNNRNLFDSVIDGLNRLPRPAFAFGIIYLFGLCWVDPVKFATGASNLDLIPFEMWGLLSIIVTFYFGDRVLKGWGKGKIREHIAKNISTPSASSQGAKRAIPVSNEEDPQEGMEWEERVENRYSYND